MSTPAPHFNVKFPANIAGRGDDLKALVATASDAEVATLLIGIAKNTHRIMERDFGPADMFMISAMVGVLAEVMTKRHGYDPGLVEAFVTTANRMAVEGFGGARK